MQHETAARFVGEWLKTFEVEHVIPREDGFSIPPRPSIRDVVINPWKGRLGIDQTPETDDQWYEHADFFKQAPFLLTAVANRTDLAKGLLESQEGSVESAGEGRFVFQIIRRDENNTIVPLAFTAIFEYEQIATTKEELQEWAIRWRRLADEGQVDDADYLAELATLTQCFTNKAIGTLTCPFSTPNQDPDIPPISQIRTNEIELALRLDPRPKKGPEWELREFIIPEGSEANPRLENTTVKETPDKEVFNDTSLVTVLAEFINSRVDGFRPEELSRFQISNGVPINVPERFEIFPFLSGHAITPATWLRRRLELIGETEPRKTRPVALQTWLLGTEAEGRVAPEDRLWFSFNTCNGCHSGDTGTVFTHIDQRGAGRRPPGASPDVPLVPNTLLSTFLCDFDLPARRRILVQMQTIAVENNFDRTVQLMRNLALDAREESAAEIRAQQGAIVPFDGRDADGDDRAQDEAEVQELNCTVPQVDPLPGREYDPGWMACMMLEREQRVH